MKESERKKKFDSQLAENARQTVNEFLTMPEYESIRKLYLANFDKIREAILDPRKTLRTCSEDIMTLDPAIRQSVNDNFIFYMEIHRAIRDGILTKDMFY